MCFKTEIHVTRTEIETRFNRRMDPKVDYEPRYYLSAFEFPNIPVITIEQPEKVSLMHWGLIPSWVRDEQKAKEFRVGLLNARSESILDRISFKHATETFRCLVICHGYYEWQHKGKLKIPHYIRLKTNEPFAIAGIYDKWQNEKTGEELIGFSMLTCDAIPFLANIHNTQKRMPFILTKNIEDMWLNNSVETNHLLQHITTPLDHEFEAWSINDMINDNKANRNTPELLKPRLNADNSAQLSLF